MSDLRLIIRAKCAAMVRFREEMGTDGKPLPAKQAAEWAGIHRALWSQLECLSVDPRGAGHWTHEHPNPKFPTWTLGARKVAELIGLSPEDIWTDALLGVKQPIVMRDVSASEMALAVAEAGADLLPFQRARRSKLADAVKAALGELTAREQDVLRRRFGLEGPEETLDAVAARIGVGRERVRMIEAKALRKLRHPSRANALRGLGDDGCQI